MTSLFPILLDEVEVRFEQSSYQLLRHPPLRIRVAASVGTFQVASESNNDVTTKATRNKTFQAFDDRGSWSPAVVILILLMTRLESC